MKKILPITMTALMLTLPVSASADCSTYKKCNNITKYAATVLSSKVNLAELKNCNNLKQLLDKYLNGGCINKPNVNVPDVETPDVNVPDVETPDVNVPDVETPDVNVPDTETPDVETPDVNAPDVETPDVNVPDVEAPDVNVPDTETPDVNVPEVEVPSENTQIGEFASQVLSLVNAERAKQGLSALTYNTNLETVAKAHSKDMAVNNYFNHTNLKGQSPFDRLKANGISYRAAAENIAAGQKTPAEVMNSWMNSAGHRANILNSSVTQMGLGIYEGGSYGIYWTQMFIG